jgi:hypothetical protein
MRRRTTAAGQELPMSAINKEVVNDSAFEFWKN